MSGLFLPWDVDWESHPRFVALRRICGRADRFERAVCLYVSMCCWSKKHRTDGQVPSELHASPRQVEAKSWLTRVGLVDDLGTTCLILGFTERNATREEVEEKREVWRDKKRRQRFVSPGDTALRDRDRDRDRDRGRGEEGDTGPMPGPAKPSVAPFEPAPAPSTSSGLDEAEQAERTLLRLWGQEHDARQPGTFGAVDRQSLGLAARSLLGHARHTGGDFESLATTAVAHFWRAKYKRGRPLPRAAWFAEDPIRFLDSGSGDSAYTRAALKALGLA